MSPPPSGGDEVPAVNPILASVLSHANARGVFSKIEALPDRLRCHAKDCPEPAWYELAATGDVLTVRFATPDRWLSESIEGDMLEGRDTAEELVDDELVEVTPLNIRLRKRALKPHERKRAKQAMDA
jgi:hypothetical protein